MNHLIGFSHVHAESKLVLFVAIGSLSLAWPLFLGSGPFCVANRKVDKAAQSASLDKCNIVYLVLVYQ